MKKIVLVLLAYLCSAQLINAQEIKDSLAPAGVRNNKLSMQYLDKGKSLETIGFVLIGTGMAATIGGFYGALNHYDIFSGSGSGYVILWAVGVSALATGIPVLVNGFRYKRKAQLVLHNENVFRTYHIPIKQNVFSVGIAFNLK
jgi:hypothetical protein